MKKGKFRLSLVFLFLLFVRYTYGQPSIHSFQANKMGTEFNIKVFGEDSLKINKAVQAAWVMIDSLNDIFSDYSHTSELAHLHQDTSGKFFSMSPDFAYLMDISLKYSCLSNGAFDVSVGPLTRIWRRAVKLNDFPDSIKIREALRYVGYKKIAFKKNHIRLQKGMRLDFGAIAKGYSTDKAYRVLAQLGYPISLVDGGGDIYIGDAPPGKPGWEIKMTVKDKGGWWKDSVINVCNASMVTSGDAYKFIEDRQGLRYSHLINPRTGYGIPGPHMTTVLAENGMHADALATALSVMNPNFLNRFRKKWRKQFPFINPDWKYYIVGTLGIYNN